MKTNNTYPNKVIAVLAFSAALLLWAKATHAQHYVSGTKNFYMGLEGSVSTRSFQLTSDNSDWNGLRTLQRGGTGGLILGSNIIVMHVKYGSYKSDRSGDSDPIKMRNFETGFRFFPFQSENQKKGYVRPYLLASVDKSTLKLNGTFVPAPTTLEDPCSCSCTASASPAPSSAALADPQSYSGKLITNRLNVGVGLQIHIPQPNNFVNLFAEIKYGSVMSTRTTNTAFLNTKASQQVAVEFGMSIGIARSQSYGGYKRR